MVMLTLLALIMFLWASILITCLVLLFLFVSMSRPSAVDRIAGLFFLRQSSVGLLPNLSIVCSGILSSLFDLSVIEASTASSVGRRRSPWWSTLSRPILDRG
jgi:hypothetical protein